MTTRKPTDKELVEVGSWAMWAIRQPNALELFRDSGARCPHGPICQDCLEEARAHFTSIVQGQGPVEG